jgi:hypothetical protein
MKKRSSAMRGNNMFRIPSMTNAYVEAILEAHQIINDNSDILLDGRLTIGELRPICGDLSPEQKFIIWILTSGYNDKYGYHGRRKSYLNLSDAERYYISLLGLDGDTFKRYAGL